MKCGFLTLVAVAALSACASSRLMASSDNHASFGHTSATGVSSMDSQRDIVLAVANPLESPSTNAGSSLLGYAAPRYYGAGQRAASTLAALKKSYGLREVTGWPIKALSVYCVVFEPPPGMTQEALLKALAKDDRVQLAQPLNEYSVYAERSQDAHQYNDPYVNLQRGFVETDAALAQNISQGNGVHIAIVDTGVDMTHLDLQGRIRDTHNLVDDDASAFNHDSHGTEVAGVIAANADNHQGIVGIAPKAMLSVYKACWYQPAPNAGARCNSFTLAKALAAVLDTDARIVNLSLGGPPDPLLNLLLAKLLSQDRIVIAAMPPDGTVDGFPNNVPGVIVVRESGASTAAPGVLSAPGNDILTTQPGGGYDFTSGSSMAAAHVSGIAALLLSLAPRLDAHAVHDILLRSSKVSDGTLEVNAASAVDALQSPQKTSH
ncbi:S8 family serine peptidase [Rhodanobacter sp. C03]|uniref:S8 family serine peptidase n=1 Tax=Rhodanobacter sp. C03 TaxID=1945858 RepID=UPI00098410C8|nr:S8 family serine peptidase [Rhodanobacter sp. C03]OOG56573.1 serine protease [Rhodanobacter sp. C03]